MDDQPPGPLAVPPRERDPDQDAPVRRAAVAADRARPRHRSRPHSALWLLLVLLVVAGLVAWVVLRAGHQAAPTGRLQSSGPMPVGTAKVAKGDMPIALSGLGTVTPLATVTVKTQISGQLIEVGFQEGQIVNKGDFLAQIDPRPYQVALEQAAGPAGQGPGAARRMPRLDLARYKNAGGAELDRLADRSTPRRRCRSRTTARSRPIRRRSTRKSSTSSIATSSRRSTGRVGLRQVDPGNYVRRQAMPNGIVVVTQLQPISVIFTLPEDNLPAVLKQLHAGATLPVTAYDRSGTTKLDTGTLETIDNQIDTTTGTVKLRAIFDNPERAAVPQPVRQRPAAGRHAARCRHRAERGDPARRARHLRLSRQARQHGRGSAGDAWARATARTSRSPKGLTPGQLVVIDGADRLKDGAKVSLVGAGQSARRRRPPQPGAPPGPGRGPAAAASGKQRSGE